MEESRARYQQATAPKAASQDTQAGQPKTDPTGKGVETPRSTATADQDASRSTRSPGFLGPKSSSGPPVVYRDPFGPFFYMWLFDRATAGRRAEWAYHHRTQIDETRWADMVRRDPQLESRVKQLESQNQSRDLNYVPPEFGNDPNLMYSDQYLAAARNRPPQRAHATVANPRPMEAKRMGSPWTSALGKLAMLGLGAFVVWLVFVRQFPKPGRVSRRDQEKKTMPTLFQIVKDRFLGRSAPTTPEETGIYNPLSAQCGSFVAVDAIDFRGKNFRVVEIQQYDHDLGGKRFQLVNYVLRFDEEVVRLRAVPFEGRTKVMLLSVYDDRAYDEGLHNVVRDDTLKFVVDDSEAGLHEEYWRVEDVRESYKARVTILRGASKDAPPEASHTQLEYWDYWRDTEVDGVKVTQYLYVEMNTATGWFQIWRGMETEPERILVT